jgi:hypothetical protein
MNSNQSNTNVEKTPNTKGTHMKNTSSWVRAVAIAIFGLGLSGTAHALNNPDTIVVSVTPGGLTYAVAITSPMTQGYVFGTVNLAATTISTVGIGVQNTGNVAEYFSLKVSNTAPDNWAPNASAGTDQFKMMAFLNATQPADATFVDALTGSIPGAAAALYGQASTRTTPTTSKNLWLRMSMPTAVTGTGGAQTMTIFVNGQSS